jgi:hypothetical protein
MTQTRPANRRRVREYSPKVPGVLDTKGERAYRAAWMG